MRGGERAEVAGEFHLGLVAEDVGLAEDECLVFVECGPDLRHGFRGEIAAEVEASDFGADARPSGSADPSGGFSSPERT